MRLEFPLPVFRPPNNPLQLTQLAGEESTALLARPCEVAPAVHRARSNARRDANPATQGRGTGSLSMKPFCSAAAIMARSS